MKPPMKCNCQSQFGLQTIGLQTFDLIGFIVSEIYRFLYFGHFGLIAYSRGYFHCVYAESTVNLLPRWKLDS